MATLLLSGLGGAIGGQFGALAGALVGRSIDSSFGGGKARRAKENLTIQTASYGRLIPRIYGRIRVGGAVIWSTDLIAISGTSSKLNTGGSNYYASFAVALSSRKAERIGRIWADGQLLRGAAGDFKVATKFRFYSGDEDQSVDPLIASIDGIESSPAFRGLAIAVFEELQLASFGNRIPILTFELIADKEVPTVQSVLLDLGASSGGAMETAPATLTGFAATGETGLECVTPLVEAFGLNGFESAGDTPGSPRRYAVSLTHLGCATDNKWMPTIEERRDAIDAQPTACGLGFFDESLDYQAGEQRASWSGFLANETRIELPAVLSADDAKTLAQDVLQRAWNERATTIVRLPPPFFGLRPSDMLDMPDGSELQVKSVQINDMVVIAECRQAKNTIRVKLNASSGHALSKIDRVAPASEILLLDLPAMDVAPTVPSMTIAARGGHDPWKPLSVRVGAALDGMHNVRVDNRVLTGLAENAPSAANHELLDRRTRIIVNLADDDWLTSCSGEELQSGANIALIGNELIQFQIAEPLGERRFELRSLLRGRFGTDWACANHTEGERFILLNAATLQSLELPLQFIGALVEAECHAVGDGDQAAHQALLFQAEALRPPSPVHLAATIEQSGAMRVDWVRRSRLGYHWFDFVDAPLGEVEERYRVSIFSDVERHDVSCVRSSCLIAPDILETFKNGPVTVEVIQLGSAYPSRPTSIQIRI